MTREPSSTARADAEACSSEIMLLGHSFVCQREAGHHRKHYKVAQATSRPSGDLTAAVVEWSDE